jgi:hypothetical protein
MLRPVCYEPKLSLEFHVRGLHFQGCFLSPTELTPLADTQLDISVNFCCHLGRNLRITATYMTCNTRQWSTLIGPQNY